MPQVGNVTLQKVLGHVEHTRIAKHKLWRIEAPSVKAKAFDKDDNSLLSPCTVTTSVQSVSSMDRILRNLENMDLEDAPISNALCLRICDLFETFKREGIKRNSPCVHALITIGMNEVENY